MRFMIIVKATRESEQGRDTRRGVDRLDGRLHEQLAKAGALLDASGLQPSAKGWRVRCDARAAPRGRWPVRRNQGVDRRLHHHPDTHPRRGARMVAALPNPTIDGGACGGEVRQIFELEDFGASEAAGRFRDMGAPATPLTASAHRPTASSSAGDHSCSRSSSPSSRSGLRRCCCTPPRNPIAFASRVRFASPRRRTRSFRSSTTCTRPTAGARSCARIRRSSCDYSGPAQGVWARPARSTAIARSAKGQLEITESAAPSLVAMRLRMLAPIAADNRVRFTLEPDGNATRVTWAHGGRRAVHRQADPPGIQHGSHGRRRAFESGLTNLRAMAEGA